MNDPKDLMEQIARLDDELDIQPKHPQPDPTLQALIVGSNPTGGT